MPLQLLQFRPGISRESTDYANEGGWYACDKIRFRSGLPEKLGGWVPYGSGTYLGTCRWISDWLSLSGYYLLAVGTNLKFYVQVGGQYYDITPIRQIDTLPANPFYPIYSTLSASISATATTLTVASGTSFNRVTPYVITIGSEQIYVPYASGTTLGTTANPCIRGYNGTTAAAHSSGDVVSSSWLVASDTGNGAAVDDFVTFANATAFGPYTAANLNKEFQIVAASSTYIAVDTGIQSTSATNGGGSFPVTAYYQITVGADFSFFGNGWGAGPWNGNHGWNTGYSGGGIYESLRLWSADNFGQDLFYNPRNGGIYFWPAGTCLNAGGQVIAASGYPEGRGVDITSATFATVAAISIVQGNTYEITFVGTTNFTLIGAASNTVGVTFVATGAGTGTGTVVDPSIPVVASYVFVTDERFVVAMGCNDPNAANPTQQDPMFLAWSDQENPQVWTPAITNQAGSNRFTYGSKLVTVMKQRQEILVWTDAALYSMQYVGAPYVYGFYVISNEITIVSPNAATTANNITYWMGQDKFYVYSGRVDTLPCALRQYIFDDINTQQWEQVTSGTNEKYNEVWWFYPSANSDVVDRYVVYNYLEKLWYYGQLNRTAWFDSHIIGNPLAATTASTGNIIVQHETGPDDGTTNPPSAIESYITSADFDLGEGNQFSFIRRIIPDVDFIGSTNTSPFVTMTVGGRDYPGQGDNVQTTDMTVAGVPSTTQTVAQVYNYTEQAWVRLRARQVNYTISSSELGVRWQAGVTRLDIQQDGRR